jgi:hypothetical protein
MDIIKINKLSGEIIEINLSEFEYHVIYCHDLKFSIFTKTGIHSDDQVIIYNNKILYSLDIINFSLLKEIRTSLLNFTLIIRNNLDRTTIKLLRKKEYDLLESFLNENKNLSINVYVEIARHTHFTFVKKLENLSNINLWDNEEFVLSVIDLKPNLYTLISNNFYLKFDKIFLINIIKDFKLKISYSFPFNHLPDDFHLFSDKDFVIQVLQYDYTIIFKIDKKLFLDKEVIIKCLENNRHHNNISVIFPLNVFSDKDNIIKCIKYKELFIGYNIPDKYLNDYDVVLSLLSNRCKYPKFLNKVLINNINIFNALNKYINYNQNKKNYFDYDINDIIENKSIDNLDIAVYLLEKNINLKCKISDKLLKCKEIQNLLKFTL